MNRLTILIGLILTASIAAQDSPFRHLEIISGLQRPASAYRTGPSAVLKNVQSIDDRHGIAYTADAIFATSDGGSTWRQMKLDVPLHETIGSAAFADALNGYV